MKSSVKNLVRINAFLIIFIGIFMSFGIIRARSINNSINVVIPIQTTGIIRYNQCNDFSLADVVKLVNEISEAQQLIDTIIADEFYNDTNGISISDLLFIGDSNTVIMNQSNEKLKESLHVSAIVGVGLGTYKSYTNKSNTTNGRTLKNDLDTLDDNAFEHTVIFLGMNDYGESSSRITENYSKLIDYIRDRNSKSIINIVTLPYVNERTGINVKNSDIDRVNTGIRKLESLYENINIIELNEYLDVSDMSTGKNNGYHLSSFGAYKAVDYIIENSK